MTTKSNVPTKVVVHPLVLLSTVDHYNRVARDTNKRVVGILLGEVHKGVVDITNSYAVPFEEDDLAPGIWFLDHNYHENMYAMYKKVNARENIVGWYSTGPRIRSDDLAINELIRNYTPNPVYVIIDVQPKEDFEIPTKSYVAVEEVKEDGTEAPALSFHHITSEIGALEAEEVGVEHLLRDVKDTSVSTLATQVNGKLLSLKSFISHLKEIRVYLENVCQNKLPINHTILSQLQDVFNLAPNLDVAEVARNFSVKTNDMMLVIYLSSLVRSVIALHSLINNKLENREAERKVDQMQEEREKKEKEGEKKKEEKKEEKKDVEKKEEVKKV
ncbi:hypothetical protein PROFUN_05049 [Planoprotostelium fungivorum]|uniref:MPN domain-containing protein n=1 Tax=Planoprotostelium fungivorum TaxID=1890364 RepID=A0A2P6NS85_9EUKA|nr:hypothetical protein PROFUN_05049 [Planoprotostelium fungivorum]